MELGRSFFVLFLSFGWVALPSRPTVQILADSQPDNDRLQKSNCLAKNLS